MRRQICRIIAAAFLLTGCFASSQDPWYYVSEITYPFATPEYVFQEGSLRCWYGF